MDRESELLEGAAERCAAIVGGSDRSAAAGNAELRRQEREPAAEGGTERADKRVE